MKLHAFLATATLLAAVAGARAADAPARFAEGVLVDAKGMTLYTFDKDTANSGKSACNGPCATAWPPAMAAAGDKPPSDAFGVVTRDDGSKQWAHRGKPLYTYQGDKKPGDKTGDQFKEVWHVVKE